MTTTTKCLVFAVFLLGVLGGALASHASGQSLDHVIPSFNYSEGWMGADAAYSIALVSGKSLWLFGDTFVGSQEAKLRSQAKAMIRNSIGISTCKKEQSCTMEYFWQTLSDGKPRSFFDTGKDELWYWPLDGIKQGDTLYLALLAVRNKPGASTSDAFGFQIVGTKLATVENVQNSPNRWQVTIKDLTDSRLWAGISMVQQGEYVLWYTQVSMGEGKGFMAVTRVPVGKMANPSGNWEYLRKDNRWVAGVVGDEALKVIDQPISELSVRYHPSIKKWLAISTGPEFPSPRAVARTADSPVGPWSAPQTIYEFPEMKRSAAGYDKDTFCYAVKEHIEFTDAKIAMTYACNSMVLSKTIANMDIYRPRFVVLDLPK